MQTLTGVRLQILFKPWTALEPVPGALGVVTDTRYVRCFWPALDQPTALFADGSSGIEVEGPPTPRNVVFPPGTKFLNGTRGDCCFLRRKVVKSVPVEREVKASVLVDGAMRDVTYIGMVNEDREVQEVVELTAAETADLVAGKTDRATLEAGKTFRDINDTAPADKAASVR